MKARRVTDLSARSRSRIPHSRIPSSRMHRAVIESLEERRLLTFGLTTTSSSYTVNTGANLVFSVARTAGSGAVGDLTSTLYNNTQLEAPFSATSRYSHYESGLSSGATVTATVDPNNQWILITCNDTETGGVGVIEYFLARNGYNNIYMAFYSAGPSAPSPGEMRFIMYTNHAVLTNAPAPSNNTGNTGAIESSDVFGYANGQTSSKYYGEYRAIDTQTYGVTGGGYGVFMNIGNRETSSGGPFFKDIDYQTTGTSSTELYNYTFSGHSQTENFRPGLKGPFAMEFTTGATPAAPDYSFIDTLGIGQYITGYVGASGRGTLVGTASGVPSSLQDTVALSNAADQYWATPNATTGAYTITGVLPGTYTETIYQGELATGTQTVTIAAGQTTKCNITDTLYTPPAASTVFTIGTWDGTPLGFLNSDLITYMHPTDVRMSPWAADSTGVTNYIVGTTPEADFPMAEWHTETGSTVNGVTTYEDTDNRITFTLTAAQAATAQTLRIGVTRMDYGRPTINVNSGAYSSPVPTETAQPSARGLTTGNWRGNNTTYTYNIPTSALVAGTNTIDIYCASGSTGSIYSGYQIYDAIDLVSTASITNQPVVTTITVTPPSPAVQINGQQQFTATAYDQFGNVIAANFTWSALNGIIDGTGLYTAPSTPGADTVTATSGSITGSTGVNVGAAPPTVATPASASPSPAYATSASLSVLGADNAGESTLTYTWSTTGSAPAPVTFSANGTNASKNTTATFTAPGTYNFLVTITDASGLSTTSSTSLIVNFGTFAGSADIGSPATAGSLSYAPATGTYTITGGGADIWGTSDQFRYNYATLNGDGQITARVDSVNNSNANAKAGVMFRDSVAANAAFANVWYSSGKQVKFETRTSDGGTATYSVASATVTAPVWLKLVRSGTSYNQFSAYYSTDDVNWTQVGTTQTITMATSALAGLAVTSHNNTAGVLNTAVFDNVALTPAWLGSGSAATWNPTNQVLTVTGAASIIADPGTDEPVVQASGTAAVLTLNPTSGIDIHLGGLSLTNGAKATETSLGSARSLTNYHLLVIGTPGSTTAPLFTIDSTSTLDLADNDMAILYGTGTNPLPQVQEGLQTAYDNGAWDKPGLTSSVAPTTHGTTALGYATSNELGDTTFDGLTLGGNALLVKYTLVGDTTLSGSVSGADYNTVLGNFDAAGDWSQGNFFYTGTYASGTFTNGDTGGSDYNAVLSNYDASLATYLPAGTAAALAPTAALAVSPAQSTANSSAPSITAHKPTHTPSHRHPLSKPL